MQNKNCGCCEYIEPLRTEGEKTFYVCTRDMIGLDISEMDFCSRFEPKGE